MQLPLLSVALENCESESELDCELALASESDCASEESTLDGVLEAVEMEDIVSVHEVLERTAGLAWSFHGWGRHSASGVREARR